MITKRVLILLWIYACLWEAFGQGESYHTDLRFQKPSDLTINAFDIDYPGASAIYLLNDGHTDVYHDPALGLWKASTYYFYRIKILQPDAFDVANIEIPLKVKGRLATKEERLRDLKATTYNYNEIGYMEIAELPESDIIRNKVKKDLEVVSFALPQVKVNSIIEVSYVVDSPYLAELDDFYFQKEHPVLSSKYSVSLWHDFQYAFVLSGLLEPSEIPRTNFNYMEKTWVMRGVHGFEEEPYMSSKEDHISKLALQLNAVTFEEKEDSFLKSWGKVKVDLLENKRFASFYFSKSGQSYLRADAAHQLEMAKRSYSTFKSDYQWDRKYGIQPNVSFKEVQKKKRGNSSALGLMLYQSLMSEGFEVDLVMCSPRINGKLLKSYPLAERLLVTLVRLTIGDEVYLLDPINNVPFGYLDKGFLNGEGLVLGDLVTWQDLTINALEYKKGEVNMVISEDKVKGGLTYELGGYAAHAENNDLKSPVINDWEWSDFEVEEIENNSKQIKASLDQPVTDERMFIPLVFDQLIFGKNPFQTEERLYPIDFYFKKNYDYKVTIDLSEVYQFDFVPESQTIQTDDGQLLAVIDVKKQPHKLEIDFQFRTSKTHFPVEEYAMVRSAFELMEKLAEMEIFVKRKE